MMGQATAHAHPRVSEGMTTFIGLVFLLLSVTGSINAANWADGLGLLTWAALGGLVLAIVLARVRLGGALKHLLMPVAGVALVGLLATMLLPAGLTLLEKWILLRDRLAFWLRQVLTGEISGDNLVFVLQVGLLSWAMGYIAGWFVYRRHQVWGAILPTGAAILFNVFYAAPQTEVYLGIYILSALLLLTRLHLYGLEQGWRGASVSFTGDIRFDVMRYGLEFSLLLMAAAWLLPASAPGPSWFPAFEPLQGPWQDVEDQFNRAFSSLRAVTRPAPSTFFGTTLTMGGPVHLGDRPVMDIRTESGRYWGAAVYDKYTGIGWINTHVDSANLAANDTRLEVSGELLRAEVTQTVQVFLPNQNILYAQAQPIRFNLPIEIRYAALPAAGSGPTPLDVALVRSRRTLRENDFYTVVSRVSVADEDSLRAASSDYAPWMQSTYLQLPSDLPERVRTLAQQITAGETNAYDKATAIEQYLREHIRYNDAVSAPPPGRDGVDYTLFDRPEGYCNYYASAMTVLARAVGLPARVVSGYSLGDHAAGVYHVLEVNAHSWVQVYIPNYGWIEFEPTTSQPEITRPAKAVPSAGPSQSDETERTRRSRSPNKDLQDEELALNRGSGTGLWSNPAVWALTAGGALLLVVVSASFLWLRLRERRWALVPPATRAYSDMLERAGWLGIRLQKHATPFERARVIGDALQNARGEVDRAAHFYVQERYSRSGLGGAERAELAAASATVQAEWRREMGALAVRRLLDPPRAFVARVHHAIERWGK